MGLSINQNIAAVNSYRNLSNTQNDLSKSLEKLSSGFRINRAADDAAGLAISEGLRSQVGGLKVAARNAQDGISVVQTAEGALTEVHSILQRVRDLAVQGANDSNNAEARANIKTESDSLIAELGRIAESTNFNGTKLLNGAGSLNFQVGADGDANSAITVDLTSADVSGVADALKTTTQSFDYTAPAGSAVAITIDGEAVNLADGTALAAAVTQINTELEAAGSTTRVSASGSDMVVSTVGTTAATVAGGTALTNPAAAATSNLSFATHAESQASINAVDAQIKAVSTARAELGAYQNRFEHTIKNINVAVENLSASESRIRDTDMASEMVSFTRAQILSQAGTAMLAQANQIPQGVLSLLR